MDFMLMKHEFIMAGIITLILFMDFAGAGKRTLGWAFSALTLGLMAYVLVSRQDGSLFGGSYSADMVAWFTKAVILLGAFLAAMISIDSVKVKGKHAGAYYFLLGASTLGMMFLVSSKELISMYVALELSTICLYALTAIYKDDNQSLEGGIKYLILGAISSGILLYGISLVYGSVRSTYLEKILFYTSQPGISPVFIFGAIMMLLGVGFKLSMVPMHVWTPDVYQGAPTPVTAFVSVASKAAGFVFAIRIFYSAFLKLDFVWLPILAVIAFLTMTIGNLVAIPQRNIKRLLAYSTISQAGYILVGFVGASVIGISSVIFYLLAYTVTNMAAFAVVAAISRTINSDEIEDYSGLAQRQPVLALTLMIALLSLAGIPPLAGFVGKVYLFYAAMQKGFLWLVIAGALNSTVSLYYYLLVLKRMYIWDGKKEIEKATVPASMMIVLILTMLAILAIGIMPSQIIDLTIDMAQKLFM